MISGLWGNSNWDDDKGTRRKALLEIEESFNEAVRNVYNTQVKEIDFQEDPFFSAMKLPNLDDTPKHDQKIDQ